jgi:hypothetical protein
MRAIMVSKRAVQAADRHPADLRECPLLEGEPPFLPGINPTLETLLSLCPIYFLDGLPGARRFTSHCTKNSRLSRRQTTMKPATDLPVRP